jgi:CDP-diacylglycerol--glycerol-3-phosphate 3-phosphatidyltransferase
LHAARRKEAIAEIGLGRRARTDDRARCSEEIELCAVGVRRMYDGRSLIEAAGPGEKLDRAAPVLGPALLDLAGLFVRVDVERKSLCVCVVRNLLEPLGRTGPNGVGCHADPKTGRPEILDLREILLNRFLAEARKSTARIGDVEEDELDSGRLRRFSRGERLGVPKVMELAHSRVAGGAHLPIGGLVRRSHESRILPRRFREHRLSPRPEVVASGRAAQGALERVAVSIDEPGQLERGGHGPATLPLVRVPGVHWRKVRRSIPNALTILRFAAIPVFAVLFLRAGDAPAWGAGVFFAGAAATDQLDGYLARRWEVQSHFGTVADPLADRLMIGTAVVLMCATGRLPLLPAIIVLGRDLLLVLGYRFLAPRGFELDVSGLGKVATWVLYASLCLVMVTEKGTEWPLVLFWIGVALAVLAGVQYALRARRIVGPH